MSRSDPSPSYSDGEDIARDLLASADAIGALSQAVAHARVVVSFSSDRCKVALATATQLALAEMVAAGEKTSVAGAESRALASPGYSAEIDKLRAQELLAETTIAQYEAAKCLFEARRSILSLRKTEAGIL